MNDERGKKFLEFARKMPPLPTSILAVPGTIDEDEDEEDNEEDHDSDS